MKMLKVQLLLIGSLILPQTALGWGQPATATTTIQANITHWTEDPCDFPEHQDKCEVKQELNIPVVPVRIPTSTKQGNVTNYE